MLWLILQYDKTHELTNRTPTLELSIVKCVGTVILFEILLQYCDISILVADLLCQQLAAFAPVTILTLVNLPASLPLGVTILEDVDADKTVVVICFDVQAGYGGLL
jgi:hypothetical protein